MRKPPSPNYLGSVLRRYCHVGVYGDGDWRAALDRELYHPAFPDRTRQFKAELAEAILRGTITTAEYETLTGEEFDSQDELSQWLREFWRDLYGDEPIPTQGREGAAG